MYEFIIFEGPFVTRYDRKQVVDFTIPVSYGGVVAIVPFRPSGNDMGVIWQPFGWKLWIGVLASPFIFLFALAVSDKLVHGEVMWWMHIDFILRSIFMDSSASPPTTTLHDKILTMTILIVSFILAIAYTETLTSMITKPAEPNFIHNLDDLAGQTDIKWIFEQGSALTNYGKNAKEGSALRLIAEAYP